MVYACLYRVGEDHVFPCPSSLPHLPFFPSFLYPSYPPATPPDFIHAMIDAFVGVTLFSGTRRNSAANMSRLPLLPQVNATMLPPDAATASLHA